ncbi:hypothetical protein N7471_005605 [Penicillium samsonianum]|uniref:uncharacterized protein n=1 Tax=Penicillium samsonianum TaxID=1882272 RepID=UPI0025487554|nr:uncharacterized protein N7471_005605 [Penicillium samsonianum]KAJ6139119.1 hypothetical protein N7471_005605 [Penicillium samsonianum]
MTGGSDPKDDSPSAQSLMRDRERLSSEEKTETDRIPSNTLRRVPHVLFLILVYAVIALFAWAVLCILARRLIEARRYTVNLRSAESLSNYPYGMMSTFT